MRLALALQDCFERLDQPRPQQIQLLQMKLRQPSEHFLAACGRPQTHTPTIVRIGCAFEQTFFSAPIDQFDDSIVLQSQGFGCIGNRRRTAIGHTGDCKQKLMLLRVQAHIVGRILTDQQKLP